MKKDLKCSSLKDNRWLLRSTDLHGNGVVKIICIECRKEVGGDNGKHDKINIQNLFNNFRWKYLMSANHVKNWCAHNYIAYADHLQSIVPKGMSSVPLTPEMHQNLIQEGMSIMEGMNGTLGDSQKHFTVFQPLKDGSPKSFWKKVHCFYYREMLGLCPPRMNLEFNLQQHLASAKHLQALEQSKVATKIRGPLQPRRRGWPALSSGISIHSNQPNLGRWWRSQPTIAEDNVVCQTGTVAGTEEGESSTVDRNVVLDLLCWGFRGPTCSYGGVSYCARELLNDLHVGGVWYPEPHITATFIRNDEVVKINGTFKHKSYMRVDKSGKGFLGLSCSMCSDIPLQMDFQKRIVREDHSAEKRGSRTIGARRRLGYLSMLELAKHAQDMRKKLQSEKWLHQAAQARIVQLRGKHLSFHDLVREVGNGHNVIKLCQSIINAYRSRAFSGKTRTVGLPP